MRAGQGPKLADRRGWYAGPAAILVGPGPATQGGAIVEFEAEVALGGQQAVPLPPRRRVTLAVAVQDPRQRPDRRRRVTLEPQVALAVSPVVDDGEKDPHVRPVLLSRQI